jgi:hypothetical protein
MKLLILALFLAATPCFAIDVSACGDTIGTRNATYTLTDDLNYEGSGSCLTVTAANPANVIIDCGGHSITFQSRGINLGDRDNIEIRNCTFISAGTNYTTAAFSWFAISGHNNSASNISVHDNVFNLGHDTSPEPYGFFVSNLASDNVEIYDNVCNIGGAYRSTCFGVTGAGAKTNWNIHHNTIMVTGTSNGRPTGVDLQGTTSADVSYNTIQVNTPETIGDVDEFQAISCFNCVTPNLHHNTITEYGTHGRIFSVDNVTGGTLHHNTLNMRGDGTGGNLQGFGMRGNTVGVEVYQNVIDARGCGSAVAGGCAPMWIGNDTNPGDGTFPSNNRIHDNWIYMDGTTQMVALELSDELEADNRFWNMTIVCEDDSYCLKVDPLNQAEPDVEFAYFDFQDSSTRKAAEFYASANISDFYVCESEVNGSPFASGDIANNGSTLPVGEPTISSSPCLCETAELGCGPDVGARPDEPEAQQSKVAATIRGQSTTR